MQKIQLAPPTLSILIQPSFNSGLSGDAIAEMVLPLIGGALTREYSLLSFRQQRLTEPLSLSATREMVVRTWSDFSTMVSELQNIVVQLKTLMSSYSFSLTIFVGETMYEWVEDWALGISAHYMLQVMDTEDIFLDMMGA